MPIAIGIHGWSYGGFMTLNAHAERFGCISLRHRRSAGDKLAKLRHDIYRTLHGASERRILTDIKTPRYRSAPRI